MTDPALRLARWVDGPGPGRCPHCRDYHDISEVIGGSLYECASCGAHLEACYSADDWWWFAVVKRPPTPLLTGRQRTRKRWAKRGRR